MGYLMRELLSAGLLHEDVKTVAGEGLARYCQEPGLDDGEPCMAGRARGER